MAPIKFICFDVNGVLGQFDEKAWLDHVANENKVFPETLHVNYQYLKLLQWGQSWFSGFFDDRSLIERAVMESGQRWPQNITESQRRFVTRTEGMRLFLMSLRKQGYIVGLYSGTQPWDTSEQGAIEIMAAAVGTKDVASDILNQRGGPSRTWNHYAHSLYELSDKLELRRPQGDTIQVTPDEILFITEEQEKIRAAKNAGVKNPLLFRNPEQLRQELLRRYKIKIADAKDSDKCLEGATVSPKETTAREPGWMSVIRISGCKDKPTRLTIVFRQGQGYVAYIRSRDSFDIFGPGSRPVAKGMDLSLGPAYKTFLDMEPALRQGLDSVVIEITPSSDDQYFLFGTVATANR